MRGSTFRLFLHHSLEPSLLGFQMATFSLCVHMVFPQYTHTSGICNALISSYYKDTSQTGSGPTPMPSYSFNYSFKDRICK